MLNFHFERKYHFVKSQYYIVMRVQTYQYLYTSGKEKRIDYQKASKWILK